MRIKTVQNAFFVILLVLSSLLFFILIRDLLHPLFWAVVLAVIFYPLRKKWQGRLRNSRGLASAMTIFSIILIVIIPLSLIGMAVSREILHVYTRIAEGEIDFQAQIDYVESTLPLVRDLAERAGIDLNNIRENLSSAAVAVSQYLASQALSVGSNAVRFTALSFIMLYVLYFLIRDAEQLMSTLVRALPLGDERERRLFTKFAEVSRATIKGTLVVAVVQGSLGGLLFWILGIGAPVLWGVLMTVLSLLPAIGSALIWFPAAMYLIAIGSVVKGVILIAGGTLLIGLVDNLLRPILVGRDTKMPDYLVLIATLGGLTVFGISGFVIGPIIAALFLSVWDMFQEEYAPLDDAHPSLILSEPSPTPPDDHSIPPVDSL